ncbi:MAG: GNAT family N-acetyltransferase [Clostridia bacterium]|nr:GNAT family N-acetyltransferase [Clostridia bacterium]
MIHAALTYLNRDRAHFSGMLDALLDPETELAAAGPEGVLLRSHGMDLVSARDARALTGLLPLLGNDDLLAHEPFWEAPLLARGYRPDMRCYACLYEGAPLALKPPAGVEIRRLGPEWLDFVHAHYRGGGAERTYLLERIEAGMFGLFVQGEPAGFIGTHDVGEMGLLEILPAWRRRGYARLLEARLIDHILETGRLAHCEVEIWNEPSLALQRGLGLAVSRRECRWYTRG